MWCGQCQQDVPAVVSTRGDERLCCPRCATELATELHEAADFQPDWTVDDWELQQDLKVLDTIAADLELPSGSPHPTAHRFDPPHSVEMRHPSARPATKSAFGAASWSMIVLGVIAFLAGATLAACATQAPWLLMPAAGWAIGGQLLLTIGLLLRLESLYRQRQNDVRTLVELQRKLREEPRSPMTPGPHQLLTDLRSRLDQLSTDR